MLEMILGYLQRPEVLSALLVIGDLILSIFQYRKTSAVVKKTTDVKTDDIKALIEYHDKVSNELKKKL